MDAFAGFLSNNNYDAIPPTLKEAVNTLNTARKLKS